jgi:hypothetical protein
MLSMAEALQVKKRAEARLFSIPGVHTIGFGAKVSGGKPVGEFAIIVHVSKKKLPSEILPGELIPPEIDGVKTDVVESSAQKARFRVLQGGDEIIPEHVGGGEVHANSGTLGCVARNAVPNSSPPDVLLSCHHVLFQLDESGAPGDDVNVSSCSGCCHPTVAKVLAGPPINADLDAAIAKLEQGVDTKAQLHNVPVKGTLDLLDPGLPAAIQTAIANQTYRVYQYGQKSSLTRGVITSIHSTTTNPAHSGQIEVAPVDRDYFSQKGDSGSMVYNDSNQIVGLHWGGDTEPNATGKKDSYANHIAKVLAAFPGLRIATNPPDVIYRTPGVRRLPPVVERLHHDLVAAGCIDYYVGLYGMHSEEFRRLFAHSRHFISAWHRNLGPDMVRAVMDLVQNRITALPEMFENRTWKECTHRIAGALLLDGSESLRADVLRFLSFVAALGGQSYADVLQLMRSLAMVAN